MVVPKISYATILPFIVFIGSYVLFAALLHKSMESVGAITLLYLGCSLFFCVIPVLSVANKNKVTTFYDSAAWIPAAIANVAYAVLFAVICVMAAKDTPQVSGGETSVNEAQGLGMIFAICTVFLLSTLFFAINSAFAHEFSRREKLHNI